MSRPIGGFTSVKTEGGLLPSDVLARIGAGDPTLPGTQPDTYHLAPHVRIGEAVNQAWSRLLPYWRSFQTARLANGHDPGTGLTRDRWLLPLFQELGFGRLAPKVGAIDAGGKAFAISHVAYSSPIHLLGYGLDLDERTEGAKGAAKASPHGLVQEFLNRSDGHLWGFVSNGLRLRVLRDHQSLTRQSYVEFDLEAIMDGEQYADFLLVWMVCHQSRVYDGHDCWLERWFKTSQDEGIRALERLRGGVERAIAALGSGFVSHDDNEALRDDLGGRRLESQDLYRQVLRVVYRLIFLFVAEEREALLIPDAPEAAKARYRDFYAARRLRRMAERLRGGPHGDLWQGIRLVMARLYDGAPELALPGLGSFLWNPMACPDLDRGECANEHILDAIRALSWVEEGSTRYPVDWRNVGAEELGSVYEGLLELHPRVNRDARTFELDTAAGHERKSTGSYYTPTSLVDCLLDTALDPVLADAARKPDREQREKAILDLKVLDPACGSGHFLVAAARRIARRLATVRSGDVEPSPKQMQRALRDVIGRCVFGVDLNPMAVELCKVSLWMEALEGGPPLSFLDGHIQQGNALLGATPTLLEGGIPDAAFAPIEGDDATVASVLKKRNKKEREGQPEMFAKYAAEARGRYDAAAGTLQRIEEGSDEDLSLVREKEASWNRLVQSPAWREEKFRADLWCSAFVWPKVREWEAVAPTTELWRRVLEDASRCPSETRQQVRDLAKSYHFFHWHLAFPWVFREERSAPNEESGWPGGFDVVLGNPPYLNVDDTWGKGDGRLAMLKGVYESVYSDKSDLLFYFLSLGLSLTRARAGFILSRAFLEAFKAEKLRSHLVESGRLLEIVDFQNHRVFPAVGITIAIVTLTKNGDNSAIVRRAMPVEVDPNELPRLRFDSNYFEIFSVQRSDISGAPWAFPSPKLREIVERIDSRGIPLGRFLTMGQGMQTGLNEAFSIPAATISGWSLPANLVRVRLRNSDIRRYALRTGHQALLYVEDADSFDELPEAVRAHLSSHEVGLRERAAFKRGNCVWWKYTWPLHKELYDRIRICCPYMAVDNHFGLDASGRLVGLTDTTVLFDSGQPEDMRYLMALLNSRVLTFRFQFIGKLKGGGVREYFWNGLSKVPLARVEPNGVVTKAEHDIVVALVARRLQENEGLGALELEAEIEARVAGIYRLSGAEMEAVFDYLTLVRDEEITQFGDYRSRTLTLERLRRAEGMGLTDFPAQADVWRRHAPTTEADAIVVLASVLRASLAPRRAHEIALAAALVCHPRLITALLPADKRADWRRAVGAEADVATAGEQLPLAIRGWGEAVRGLRARGLLVESDGGSTWGAGPGLDAIPATPWAAGRVEVALATIDRIGAAEAEQAIPAEILRAVDVAA